MFDLLLYSVVLLLQNAKEDGGGGVGGREGGKPSGVEEEDPSERLLDAIVSRYAEAGKLHQQPTPDDEGIDEKKNIFSTVIAVVCLDFFCRGNQVASSSITIYQF
ncbi:hypothetical protein OUZ56_026711 [Daphnia magna]|uniref:Uncharacterized protein n=1 Tax=Daphnia magna TaxID=35525 RepID=A0ABQ9ZMM3_9CRUS|nr:hypothetical protein OUZ56_026711 [Daphnia magna]